METNAWVSFATQLPIVGLFVWFVLELLKRQTASDERRDQDWQEFFDKLTKASNETILTITNQHKTALTLLSEEVKKNTENISAISGILISHDTSMQVNVGGLRERLNEVVTLGKRLERIRLERDYYKTLAIQNKLPIYPGETDVDSWHGDKTK